MMYHKLSKKRKQRQPKHDQNMETKTFIMRAQPKLYDEQILGLDQDFSLNG